MATIQGMCRNCGALIVFDNRDDKCECVFCNCVFSSEEAVEILENPEGRTFANEKFEPSSDGRKHHSTRVFSDDNIEKAIQREAVSKSNKKETTVNNEFELSPKDVKAPAKFVWGGIALLALLVILVIVIATPMYKSRTSLNTSIMNSIDSVFDGVVTVDTTLDNDGKTQGYLIYGQTCQYIKFYTPDVVDEETAVVLFNNYCSVRSENRGDSEVKLNDVEMLIYSDNGIFSVSYDGNDVVVSEN